jgi:DNA-binding LacI/PurR family transcriptional regulator
MKMSEGFRDRLETVVFNQDKAAKLAGVSSKTVLQVFRGIERIAPEIKERSLKVVRR